VFRSEDYPDLIVGLDTPDDAAVWDLPGDQALVVTTDFFTPVVDDPYQYGQIAAANALSDLYAMGARPIFTLNIAAIPTDLPSEMVREIVRGGAEKVREAGAVIAGGHTIQDKEPKYGLVAVGLVDKDKIMTKANAVPGDLLILTKPIGTGVTTTALRSGVAAEDDIEEVIGWMTGLNQMAGSLAEEFGVTAATDITGFGLLGHAYEVADASKVQIRFNLPSIPFLRNAIVYAKDGHFPGGSADNMMYFGPNVQFETGIDDIVQRLLFDAQTSGGLLIFLPIAKWEDFSLRASVSGIPAWPIGVVEGEGIGITVSKNALEDVFIQGSNGFNVHFLLDQGVNPHTDEGK
jgi:selenide,water dikinase